MFVENAKNIAFKSSALLDDLKKLESKMLQALNNKRTVIQSLPSSQRISAENLILYLALRSQDIRGLQDQLHIAGLSSLTSSESHIHRQLQAILERMGEDIDESSLSKCDYTTGNELIDKRSLLLFGEKKDQSIPHIMVTFDTSFVDNLQLIKKLLEAGMNVARINCAHDDEKTWDNMIGLVKEASEKTGIPCKIYMDLAGPRLRTNLLGKGRQEGKASLMEGQELMLAELDADYDPSAIVINCSEPGIVKQLKVDDRVLFDDGVIETKVTNVNNGIAGLRIIRASAHKPRLKVGKGMNFPDSDLNLPALTMADRELIPYLCERADLIGYSFVRDASGVKELQKLLNEFYSRPSIILKIETPQAVNNLPALLLQGMMDEAFGVMIARGDLAVEIGFERLSEIQDEIAWISEAAPIIWATQVLETLNKSGIATRSEMTDASHAVMAECVMLNKGDHIIKVIKSLKDILQRSGTHRMKKRYTFRPMQIAKNYIE
jgi:pyruvate kinase